MNKPLAINRNDYANIYFASDFHYNHKRDFVWKPRGFDTYQEHDLFIEQQCDTLTKDDLLIYLGDYSLNTTDEQTSNLLHRTKAQMFYIFGNHEGYHSRFYRRALDNFATNELGLPIANFQIFPFHVDKTTGKGGTGIKGGNNITYFGEEGYFRIGNTHYFCRHMAPLIWDKMKYDNFVSLCGHSHGNLQLANHTTKDQGKILDVGMDNAIKFNGTAFFRIEDINRIMATKHTKIYDHHGDDNI